MALGFSPRDQRSRRLVAVIECALNQSARDAGAASYPAVNKALLTLCMRYDVGVVQIPCPEMRFMRLSRERPPGKSIREVLDTPAGCQCCLAISLELVGNTSGLPEQPLPIAGHPRRKFAEPGLCRPRAVRHG
jgi:hypothetical protein